LEDSIIEEEKDDALNCLCDFLHGNKTNNTLFVRLNKERYSMEAKTLSKFNVGFMLPKFESPDYYGQLVDIWNQHNIIALVETPRGVVNILEIANCVWVDAIAFGAEDFTASMNMQNNDAYLQSIKTTLVTYAKAFNKQIFDTPSFKISEQDDFEKEVENSVSLGFDGKLLINPKQIECVNKHFSEVDLDYLAYLVSEYDRRGEAVTIIDNKVYEKMHINRFRRIIKEHNSD
jgi:citrate lyase subunit beta/citryl-CoA lyase